MTHCLSDSNSDDNKTCSCVSPSQPCQICNCEAKPAPLHGDTNLTRDDNQPSLSVLKSSITTAVPNSRVSAAVGSKSSLVASQFISGSSRIDADGANSLVRFGDPGSRQYSHPLSKISRINGKFPFVEIADSPKGSRYGIQDFIGVDEDGKERRFSGIVEIPVRRNVANTGEALGPSKPFTSACNADGLFPTCPHHANNQSRKIGFSLRNEIEHAAAEDYLSVLVRLVRPGGITLTAQLEGDIARGRIKTRRDYEVIRTQRLSERQQNLYRLQDPVIARVKSLGGAITFRGKALAALTVRMPVKNIKSLAEDSAISRLDLATEEVRAEAPADAAAIEIGAQLDQFIEPGSVPVGVAPYVGKDLVFAVIDNKFLRTHHAFRKSSGLIADRVYALYTCDLDKCNWEYSTCNWDEFCGGDHGTGVAGVIFGDFTNGQTLIPSDGTDRKSVSGFARKAFGLLFEHNSSTGAVQTAFDMVATASPKVVAVNLSFGSGSISDPDLCNGLDTLSQDANDLFESGVLLIKSAGNESVDPFTKMPTPQNNSSLCLVTSPGAAIGAFTVGNYNKGLFVNVTKVRTASIDKSSSRGGQPEDFAHGRGRSIVDLAAHGVSFRYLSTKKTQNAAQSTGGTSFAAPVVTASAVILTDHYRRWLMKSDLLDDPGALYSNLLLMGDRSTGESSTNPPTKSFSGFDRNYGAGRLRMRKFDTTSKSFLGGVGGMGVPFMQESSSSCIGVGETLQINLNMMTALPNGIDVCKFVLWWYDRRHETLTDRDRIVNIDIRLVRCDASWKPIEILAESASALDNKERIFFAPPGGLSGLRLAVEIVGVSGFIAGFDYGGCAPGKIRFYYSYFCESSARPGPGLFFNPDGTGVEPENIP